MFDAIFLDRDGTISHDPYGYINNVSDYHFFDYTFNALEKLSSLTDKFFIVTNQSGISTGKVDVENVENIHAFIYDQFEKKRLPLKKIYYADNYDESFHSFRKPGIGMFEQAEKDFGVDLRNSLMIGDSIVDIQAGERCKMKTIFLLTGMGHDYLSEVEENCEPYLICDNLLVAAEKLL